VQFHHAPYSTGGAHSIPNAGLASEGLDATPSGQAGTPLRQFTPLFDEFDVTAVLAGHSEIAERSFVTLTARAWASTSSMSASPATACAAPGRLTTDMTA